MHLYLIQRAAFAAVFIVLAGCSTVFAQEEDDDGVKITKSGKLLRGESYFTIHAVEAPELSASGGAIDVVAPALAKIAEHGGNTAVFDLTGFNADGTALDPAAASSVNAIIERAFDQRMTCLVRLLPEGNTDRTFRRNAARTAGEVFANAKKAIYWIDGDEAGSLARVFSRSAKDVVSAAPEFGDLKTVAPGEADADGKGILLFPEISPALDAQHFVIAGGDENLAKLDAALANPAELKRIAVASDPALSDAEKAEGFQSLFDGVTLTGWWFFGDNEKGFAVNENGEIEWKSMGAGALYTAQRYGDFVLRLDYKQREEGANSGVFIRAPRSARQSKIGMEIQCLADRGLPIDENSCGSIYDVLAPTESAANPAGEWNTLEILAQGPRVQVTLNGKRVQDVNLDEHEELKHRLRRGFIGLQDHSNWVAFRNIRIKPL